MKLKMVVPVLLAILLASCASVPVANSVYQSSAPETRGERAISSNIELVKEVSLSPWTLGVFYSHEVFQSGDAQTLLFTRRAGGALNPKKPATITDYDLSVTSSLSTDQARKFLSAIDEYLKKDPKSLTPAQMFNFELYSGTVDMSAGSDRYRPFKDVTFIVVCSVTTSGKDFKTVFPGTVTNMYGNKSTVYDTIDLTVDQVQQLHDAIQAALALSTPSATGTAVKPGA